MTDAPLQWILDTHLHLHPQHEVDRWMRVLAERCAGYSAHILGAVVGGVLMEMPGTDTWERLRAGKLAGLREVSVEMVDPVTIACAVGGVTVHLFRGGQVVTREGIEVLGLLNREEIPSGETLTATIHAVTGAGGVPVLPWSPGKWTGRRGNLVRDYLQEHPECWIGDISIRVWGALCPLQIKGVNRRILYGSDPLPVKGGELVVGSLATGLPGASGEKQVGEKNDVMKSASLGDALRVLLASPSTESGIVGCYQSPARALTEWSSFMIGKQLGKIGKQLGRQ